MKNLHVARVDSTMRPIKNNTREIILYIIFGGLTTLVNLISFHCFDLVFPDKGLRVFLLGLRFDPLDVLNITVSWILAVLFAYVTNRIFVFRSKGSVFKELMGFFASRIATLIIFEIGLFELGIFILENPIGLDKEDIAFSIGSFSGKYKLGVKLLVAVFVVIGNYVLSKIFVFRDKKSGKETIEAEAATSTDEESENNLGQ